MDYDENFEEIHIKPEDFEIDPKEEKRRRRERKRQNRRFKFTDKEHSKTGIASSILALCALIFLIVAIVISAAAKGQGGTFVGVLGALSFLCSLVGLVLGLVSFHRTDVLLKYAWIGTFASGIIWILITLIMMIGI